MLDNLCDTCKESMTIQRNKKGSRFLVCRNAKCKRGSKNAPAPIEEKRETQQQTLKRKPLFGFGF